MRPGWKVIARQWAEPAHTAAGANVLADVIWQLARETFGLASAAGTRAFSVK